MVGLLGHAPVYAAGGAADFSPLELSPYLWYDLSDPANYTLRTDVSPNRITSLVDLSGNGRNGTDRIDGSGPDFLASGFNGLPTMLADTNRAADTPIITLIQPFTIVMVASRTTSATTRLWHRNTSAPSLTITSADIARFSSPSNLEITPHAVGIKGAYTCVANGASSLLRINTAQVTGNAGADGITATAMTLGNSNDVHISEFLMFAYALSTEQISDLEAYLLEKWAITP